MQEFELGLPLGLLKFIKSNLTLALLTTEIAETKTNEMFQPEALKAYPKNVQICTHSYILVSHTNGGQLNEH